MWWYWTNSRVTNHEKKMAFADRWPNKRKSLPINFGAMHPAQSCRRPQLRHIHTQTHADTLRWKLRPPDTSISFMGSNHRRRGQTMPEKKHWTWRKQNFFVRNTQWGVSAPKNRAPLRWSHRLPRHVDKIEWKLAFFILFSTSIPVFFSSPVSGVCVCGRTTCKGDATVDSFQHFSAYDYISLVVFWCSPCRTEARQFHFAIDAIDVRANMRGSCNLSLSFFGWDMSLWYEGRKIVLTFSPHCP